jgi:hypothetical protein
MECEDHEISGLILNLSVWIKGLNVDYIVKKTASNLTVFFYANPGPLLLDEKVVIINIAIIKAGFNDLSSQI